MVTDPINFDAEADRYHRIRPTYPPELFDRLFALLPKAPRIIEVGPGTGQATQELLGRGASVTAVELGPNLAAVLEQTIAATHAGQPNGSSECEIVVGDFEVVDLLSGNADAVVSATAYHWVSPSAQIARPAELLKPGGLLAVIDTIQITDPADQGYFDDPAVQAVYRRHGLAKAEPAPTEAEVAPPITTAMAADPRCVGIDVLAVRRDISYPVDDYADLKHTFSGPQSLPEPERAQLIGDLCAIAADRYGGVVTRPLVFTLSTCRVNVPSS